MTDDEMVEQFVTDHEDDIDAWIHDVPLLRWRLVLDLKINLPTAMRLVEQIRSDHDRRIRTDDGLGLS